MPTGPPITSADSDFTFKMVMDPKNTPLRKKELLTEERLIESREQYGPDGFVAGIGAEAVRKLLEEMDLVSLNAELRAELVEATSDTKRKKLIKRLRVIEALQRSENKPEWMILTVLPVIPPDLRPLVPLEGKGWRCGPRIEGSTSSSRA